MVMCSKDSGRITHTFFVSGWMAGNAILCCTVVRVLTWATKWDVARMFKLFVVCLNCITPQRRSSYFTIPEDTHMTVWAFHFKYEA